MCEDSDSDSDYMEEGALTSLEIEGMMSDFNDEKYQQGIKKFMPDLLSDEEELSAEKLEKMTKQFSEVFAERYSSSGLKFFPGSLDDVLNQSILNPNDPRPLIFYIRHNQSIADNTFCMKFFHSEKIVKLLNDEFVIWPWDRTNINNYRQFLKLLLDKIGSQVASVISSENQYPLLVCLSRTNDRFNIVSIIDSKILEEDMMFSMLCVARDDFDKQNNQDSIINENQNEKWHVPNSHLKSVSRQSDQFQKIVNDLNLEKEKIIDINMIENIIWSIQYSSEKRKIDDRNRYSQNEKELFYGCPLSKAQQILKEGFKDNSDGIYGRGFYFSSKRDLCEKYSGFNTLGNDQRAIIVCRIIVDENNSDLSNSNILVVYCNEQILPEYLVIYKD